MKPIIALLTDFGTKDHYVAVMKAVMLKINPELKFVDISHDVPSHSIIAGQFLLMVSHSYFPKGTVFLVVIDPGVGSARKAMVLKSGGYVFVGPDNGVFTPFFRGDWKAYELPIPKNASNTFHGRDVFAPAAAMAASGKLPQPPGPEIRNPVRLELPEPVMENGRIMGKVIYIDKFGNIVTNIPSEWVLKASDVTARIGGVTISGLRKAYAEAEKGEFLIIPGSSGYIEISIREGDAASALGVKMLDDVQLFMK